ncbi:hypothetical protein J6TS2_10860 [Heyndrickxia sporothermodurans]|nr:hypothetical protein J6TS2_10860 [Heyndrickxia sporothermodurans]
MNLQDEFQLSFMTWNLYMGAELPSLFTEISDSIPNIVSNVYRQFLATNYPVRVKAIAREIALKKPDLIGLQEAVKWQLTIPNYRTVTYDFINILINELRKKGLNYEIAAQNQNTSVELPDANGNLIQLLDRDVILVRNVNRLNIRSKEETNFKVNLAIRAARQKLEIIRGWCSVDVLLNGNVFRLINTHLDTNSDIQIQQAKEIMEGPANTILPLILVGDLNSNANRYETPTYKQLIEFGFHDVWKGIGKDSGVTCCQGPDLINAESSLNSRIDFILFKNGWKPTAVEVVGEKHQDRTATGLWPSDHAGVSAKLLFRGNKY